jgi:hypothetical protein
MGDTRLKVGLILEPPGIDDPYLHGAYVGMERAVRELGIAKQRRGPRLE